MSFRPRAPGRSQADDLFTIKASGGGPDASSIECGRPRGAGAGQLHPRSTNQLRPGTPRQQEPASRRMHRLSGNLQLSSLPNRTGLGPRGKTLHESRGELFEIGSAREPGLYGAVNKCFLSTGETRELVPDSVGFGLNPGVELALPRSLLSNWRDRAARKNVQNVADTGKGGSHRCCQDNGRGNLVRGRYGSPQNPVSNDLSGARTHRNMTGNRCR